MMGVSWEDSFIVAELIGIKTFFNEFVAYQKLSKLIQNRKAGGPEYVDHVKQYISVSLTPLVASLPFTIIWNIGNTFCEMCLVSLNFSL